MSPAKVTYHAFLALTLDGFIARPDGRVDYLDDLHATMPEGEDCGIGDFMASLDAIIMGRRTFEQALEFKTQGKGWQYGDTPMYVLTRTAKVLPQGSPASVQLLHVDEGQDGLVDAVNTINPVRAATKQPGVMKIYVDGGEVVRNFIRSNLLDEITLTTVPILLGSGIRLFGDTTADIKLRLVKSVSWDFGLVQSVYRLK